MFAWLLRNLLAEEKKHFLNITYKLEFLNNLKLNTVANEIHDKNNFLVLNLFWKPKLLKDIFCLFLDNFNKMK